MIVILKIKQPWKTMMKKKSDKLQELLVDSKLQDHVFRHLVTKTNLSMLVETFEFSQLTLKNIFGNEQYKIQNCQQKPHASK